MACPVCKSDQFYVKDQEDSFETYDFECRDGKIEFEADDAPDVDDVKKKHEIFCTRCAWHGSYDKIV